MALAVLAVGAPGSGANADTKRELLEVKSNTAAAPRLLAPNDEGAAILAHNSLIALNHANLTGNYSVFRDLAAPGFQKLNSARQLSTSFANMRTNGINLSPIVLHQPKFVAAPFIDDKGLLRMTGFYPTQPLQVHFSLVFAPVAAVWRLIEISVWMAVQP